MNESKQNTAAVLGYAGLAPFFATSMYVAFFAVMNNQFLAHAAFAGIAYGAMILSFVGALHWAHAMQHASLGAGSFIRSVIPSIVAWVAVCATLLVPGGYGVYTFACALLIGALIEHWRADQRLHARHGETIIPAWFMRLRTHLTLGACASLAIIGVSAHMVK